MNRSLVLLISLALAMGMTTEAPASQSMTFDWEDGVSTALGTYGNANLENSTEQANQVTHSLKLTESPIDGTPQAFIWWVTGLTDGDVIEASFYVYDVTPSAAASGRIWAHYTDTDVSSYAGSAGGNPAYSDGTGWDQLSHSWTFDSDTGTRDGFVVEARIYSGTSDSIIFVDTAAITISSDVGIIYNAAGDVPVEMVSFVANSHHGQVELTWETATETDNLGFNIYKTAASETERRAVNNGIVPGAGTTLMPQTYSFIDGNVVAGTPYLYWLEQVDFQGTTELFGPVSVTTPAALTEALSLSFAPVPVNESATISLSLPAAGNATVRLFDLQGREAAKVWQGETQGGVMTIGWDRGNLVSGVYMLRVDSQFGSLSERLILK